MSSQTHTAYYLMRASQHHFDRSPQQLSAEQTRWLEARVLNQQQMETKVLASAEAAAVVVPDALQIRALADIEAQYEDVNAFLDDLGRLDMSLSALNDLLARQLRVELVLEQQAIKVKPASDADARDYYESHPQQFTKPERRQAWHLLITVNPDYPENRHAKVLKRLKGIRAAVGTDLALLQQHAERHSECPSALQKGELGWVPQGHLFPEIDKALFELEAGQVSELIETDVGLHLLLCSAIKPTQLMPFEEVLTTLLQKLTEAQQRKAQQIWMRSL